MIFTSSNIQAQSKLRIDSLQEEGARELNDQVNRLYDSLNTVANLNRFKDSLHIQNWSNELSKKVNVKYFLDSTSLKSRIDSLQKLNMSTAVYQRRLDSLRQKRDYIIGEAQEKQVILQREVSSRYNKWSAVIRKKVNADSLGIRLPSDPSNKLTSNIGGINKGNITTPNLPSIPKMPRLSPGDFEKLNLSTDLKNVGGNLCLPNAGEIEKWERQITSQPYYSSYVAQVKELKNMAKDPSKSAEKAVLQIGEVSAASKQMAQAEQLKSQNEAMQVAEAMKDPAQMEQQFPREALNHFQGKEQQLQQAMDQFNKYKKKYYSLPDVKQAKKLWIPVNSLKGQPFRKRFRVGLHAGYRPAKDTAVIDFFPNVSYKLTGRFEFGIGSVYRVKVLTSNYSTDQRDAQWGFSSFLITRTFKSTYFRIETDGNSYLKQRSSDASYYSVWRWTFLAGVQTNFKISESLTGNVQMLYSFDKQIKDAFPEKLSMRMGVQYQFPSKKK